MKRPEEAKQATGSKVSDSGKRELASPV